MALAPRLRRWLLGPESDPSVRLKVLREVLDRPESDPAVRRARHEIGRVGWASWILRLQLPAGQWTSPKTTGPWLYGPKYIATNWHLLVLAELGVSGRDVRVRRALRLVDRAEVGAKGGLGGKSSEICFTGNSLRMRLQFGRERDPVVGACLRWILDHQKPDGGWHCFPSRRGTLDGWEGLSAFARLPPRLRTAEVEESIRRGAEFYLDRELLNEGPGEYAPWRRLHFPVHYYYDVLVGLEMLTRLGYGSDPRLRRPLRLLESLRNPDGTWNLDAQHPDSEDPNYSIVGKFPFFPYGLEAAGQPSRWITASALAVRHRAGR